MTEGIKNLMGHTTVREHCMAAARRFGLRAFVSSFVFIYFQEGGCGGGWRRSGEVPSRSCKVMAPSLMSGWGSAISGDREGPLCRVSVTAERLVLNLALIATCGATISHSGDRTSGFYGCLGNWNSRRGKKKGLKHLSVKGVYLN